MTLDHISERLQRSVEFAYRQYLTSVLARKVAQDKETKCKENYETLRRQSSDIERAIASIEQDERSEIECKEESEATRSQA